MSICCGGELEGAGVRGRQYLDACPRNDNFGGFRPPRVDPDAADRSRACTWWCSWPRMPAGRRANIRWPRCPECLRLRRVVVQAALPGQRLAMGADPVLHCDSGYTGNSRMRGRSPGVAVPTVCEAFKKNGRLMLACSPLTPAQFAPAWPGTIGRRLPRRRMREIQRGTGRPARH